MKSVLRLSLTVIALLTCVFIMFSCKPSEKEHVCSYNIEEIISGIGCDSDGVVMRYCSCGKSLTDFELATGHKYGEWETVNIAVCNSLGLKERSCSVCD